MNSAETRLWRARAPGWLPALVLAFALVGCANDKEPAQLRIGEIEGAVSAASVDAAKYTPEQLKEVQDRLSALEASYAKADYAAVLVSSPAVLIAAQRLQSDAGAAKSAAMAELGEQWTLSSQTVPARMTALQRRLDALGNPSPKRFGARFDVPAARAALADAASSWSKAQAAFASDNLREAVNTANNTDRKLQDLTATLPSGP